MRSEPSNLSGALWTFGLGLFVLISVAGKLMLWTPEGFALLPTFKRGTALALALAGAGVLLARMRGRKLKVSPTAAGFCVLLLFFSDWLCRGYNFYQGPEIRGELLLGSALAFALLRWGDANWLKWLLPVAVALLAGSFFIRSGGQPLWTDDHSTFQYRLSLLQQNFPNVLFYNPQWNAGLYAGDILATGTLNVFFAGLPLFALFDPSDVYNFVFAFIAFAVTPAAMFFAARTLGVERAASGGAAALSMTASLPWYTWGFKYGTMGFFVTCALVPLNLALVTALLSPDARLSYRRALATALSFTLMVFWAPSALIFVPAAVFACAAAGRLFRQRSFWALAAAFAALYGPCLYLLISSTNVGGFVSKGVFKTERPDLVSREGQVYFDRDGDAVQPPEAGEQGLDFSESLKTIREQGMSSNPLVLIFGVFGLLLLPARGRLLFSLTALWLLVLGAAVSPLLPHLELSRMLVVLVQCLTIPAAAAIWALFARAQRREEPFHVRAPAAVSASLAGGFLLVAPFSGSAFVWNRSLHHFYFADPQIEKIAEAISRDGGDGRVLFSGFVLHDFFHAHLAPLPLKTGKPMVARSHVHNVWWREDVIPESFLSRGDEGIEEFLDLKNITAVMAHEAPWIRYFRERPERYREVYSGRPFVMFKRLGYAPSYFLEGAGKVLSQTPGALEVRFDTPNAVLKFNYFPTVRASACRISGRPIVDDIVNIELKDCPTGRPVTIYGKTLREWFLG